MSTDLPTPVQPTAEVVAYANGASTGLAAPLDEAPLPQPAAGGLARLVSAVLRYKWWILGLTLLGAAGGAVGTRFVHPEYIAEATIWIDKQTTGDREGPLQPAELLDPTSWVQLLRSYAVLDFVVERERLYLRYPTSAEKVMSNFGLASRFRPGRYELSISESGRAYELKTQGTQLESGATGDSIGRRVGFAWQPSRQVLGRDREIKFTVLPPRDAARELDRELGANLPEKGTFLRIAYRDQNRQRVASVVNTTVDRYISIAAELKASKTREVARILQDQLASAERNLKETEGSLESFKVRTITLPSERSTPVAPGVDITTNPVLSRYLDMKVQREVLAQQQDAIRAALETNGGVVSVDNLAMVDAVEKSPELKQALDELTSKRAAMRTIRQQFTDENPLVKRAAADVETLEQQTIPRLARTVMANLGARQAELDRMVSSGSQQLEAIPPRAIEQSRLERQLAVAQDLYNNLRRRSEEARLQAETSVPDLRVLDRATVPEDPAADPRIMIVLMAVLGALGVGIAGAIALDRFDPRLRYPEEISRRLGLPILGVIPGVKTREGALGDSQVSQVLEALRSVRLSMTQAYGMAGPVVVTISSPGAGDGKSFVSANLALAFADLGHRTLVIDGDIRRGALHRLLDCTRKPGLTDYLAGRASRAQIIQRTHTPLLDMIGSGTRLQNGPELLGSSTTAQLLGQLRSEYSVILVDSPPLGAGVDPFLWGMLTGAMMIVMRAGKTDRAMAEAKLEALRRMPVRILGAILNGAAEAGVYRYYSYISGYESSEESGQPRETPLLEPAGAGPA